MSGSPRIFMGRRALEFVVMKIGFIGLGAMGGFMAANLQAAGHDLLVHDIRGDAAASLIDKGATWAVSPKAAAAGVSLLFTCLPGPAEVDAVASGENGFSGALKRGAAWFDFTTNAPDRIRALHENYAAQGVDLLDAPVSGGPSGAEARKLAFWVGGDKTVFDRHLPLLKAMGDEPMHIGPIGSGCVVKLVHNCANFSVQALLAESFTLGVKAGVDPLVLFRALRQGTAGRSRTFDRLAEQFLPGVYDPPAFTLRLAHKDMTLAAALAKAENVPMRMASIAMQDMAEAMSRGWSERDARISLTLQEERAGISVRVPDDQLRDGNI